ncbi:MAG TPA: hypothetical protein VGO67_17325 [Verrucomicrobiae bacterium]|jgi:hypothetical protein
MRVIKASLCWMQNDLMRQALMGQIRTKTAQYLDATQLFVALGGNSAGVFERRAVAKNSK